MTEISKNKFTWKKFGETYKQRAIILDEYSKQVEEKPYVFDIDLARRLFEVESRLMALNEALFYDTALRDDNPPETSYNKYLKTKKVLNNEIAERQTKPATEEN
ncbi:hypothetical protein [Roseivirga pacifica]|uniref:hypothetical protein n=1 Tax=Roseivirga pacifica TaxID=1267423 RepID=UPI002095615C|nr:hypothetical protein [Roseivirga pacifica]MCO6358565.1 hypothetical protein [Roseivirga pacifica]MCO6366641.1 hypothetical protein [Roseivirga pacifica]MCO6369305.1 hypothetical protein [Roseivirga pacifica]MCO6374309.1 hypothetical protein [Roseivirga pacifica]MCO6378497.1 hypothetical protein [Roseivirga pacifica]